MADEATATQEPQTNDAQPTVDATGPNGGTDERMFTQADVDKFFSERLGKEKSKLATEIEADLRTKIEGEQQRKQQEEAEEFKPLWESAQTEIADLKPKVEKAERYEAALKIHLDKEREGLPDHIIELLDTKDVADQLEYIAKNRDKLKPQQQRNGIPETPRANGNNPSRDEQVEQEIIAQRTGRGRPY